MAQSPTRSSVIARLDQGGAPQPSNPTPAPIVVKPRRAGAECVARGGLARHHSLDRGSGNPAPHRRGRPSSAFPYGGDARHVARAPSPTKAVGSRDQYAPSLGSFGWVCGPYLPPACRVVTQARNVSFVRSIATGRGKTIRPRRAVATPGTPPAPPLPAISAVEDSLVVGRGDGQGRCVPPAPPAHAEGDASRSTSPSRQDPVPERPSVNAAPSTARRGERRVGEVS